MMNDLIETQRVFAVRLRLELKEAVSEYVKMENQCKIGIAKVRARYDAELITLDQNKDKVLAANIDVLNQNFNRVWGSVINDSLSRSDQIHQTAHYIETLCSDGVQIDSFGRVASVRRKTLLQLIDQRDTAESSFFKILLGETIRRLSKDNLTRNDALSLLKMELSRECASTSELVQELEDLHAEQINDEEAEVHAVHQQVVAQQCEARDTEIGRLADEYSEYLARTIESIQSILQRAETLCQRLWNECTEHPSSTGFPDQVLIGAWIDRLDVVSSAGELMQHTVRYPACIPLKPFQPLLIEHYAPEEHRAAEIGRVIAHHILRCAVPGTAKICSIDPVSLGRNAAVFMPNGTTNSLLLYSPTATAESEIDALIQKLSKHVQQLSETTLRIPKATVNKHTSTNNTTPFLYIVMLVFGFPSGWSEIAQQRLVSLLRHGTRCGVLPIIIGEHDAVELMRFHRDEIRSASYKLSFSREDCTIFPFREFDQCRFEPLRVAFDEEICDDIDEIHQKASAQASKPLDFGLLVPDDIDWFAAKSNESLSVPIAVAHTFDSPITHLSFDDQNVHGMIAGPIGTGKSNLLHVIICSLILKYAPDQLELYLIDMKPGGVEFNRYANARLPHAKAIAISHEPDFAFGVLRGLHQEMVRRNEDLFANAGVNGLSDYIRVTGKRLPRILLLCDEFEAIFSSLHDDPSRQVQIDETKAYIGALIKQSRSAGIHLLLCTQQFDIRTLDTRVRENIATRIALRSSTRGESENILGDRNFAAADLPAKKRGVAILNDGAGSIDHNVTISIPFIGQQQIDTTIDAAKGFSPYADKQFIFQANNAQSIKDCTAVQSMIRTPLGLDAGISAIVYLGEVMDMAPALCLPIRRRTESNCMLLGRDIETGRAMLSNLVLQMLCQKVVLDGTDRPTSVVALGSVDYLTQYCHHILGGRSSNSLFAVSEVERYPSVLNRLLDELDSRQADRGQNLQSLFLVVSDLSKIDWSQLIVRQAGGVHRSSESPESLDPIERELSKLQDSPGLFDDLGPPRALGETVSIGATLQVIAERGPQLGIHLIIWADSLVFNQRLPFDQRLNLDYFDIKLAMQMSADDSIMFIHSKAASKLNLGTFEDGIPTGRRRVLLHVASEGITRKFRPFAPLRTTESNL